MTIKLNAVTRENYKDLMNLTVTEAQQGFVAPNWQSLLEAAYEPELNLLAIYQDERPVGLILYDFDPKMGGWTMSRLMIDKSCQHQGIGRQAVAAFIAFFTEKYPHEALYTSAELDNPIAQNLYESFGFKKLEEFSYESGGLTYHEVKMLRKGDTK